MDTRLDGERLADVMEALVADATVQMMLVDGDHRVRYLNHTQHGYSMDEVLGQVVEDLVPEIFGDRVRDAIDAALRDGDATTYETGVDTPEGPTRYRTRVAPVRLGGDVRYASLVAYDITHEYRAEVASARERTVLAALDRINRILVTAPSTPEMIDAVLSEMLDLFDCDRAFIVYPCDPEAEFVEVRHEKTAEGFIGAFGQKLPLLPWMARDFARALSSPEAVAPNDPEHDPLPEDDPMVQNFGLRSMLLTACRLEGDRPWALGIHHCREERVYDAEIPVLASLGKRVADGINFMQAQRALRESEERFRLMVEHAPDVIVIFDADTGRFVDVNPGAVELFGMTRDELLEMTPADVSMPVQPDGRQSEDMARERITAALEGQRPTFEWHHRNAAGEVLECEVRLLRLPHQGHRWVRGSIIHIAERKRAERENERLSAQLAQAQKMQAIGQLTGGVAHDFNNLLTVIGGSLTMIEQDASDAESVLRFGEMAVDACNRASQLTQRLLAFSRMQPLRPRSLSLGKLVRGMEGLLSRTLGEEIRLHVALEDELWPCEADPAQLENAILNLCINARDAMLGGGQLTIEVKNIAVDDEGLFPPGEIVHGDYVCLAVRDDGEGMSRDVMEKAFEPFFTTKEVGKGSGLGLSMVYGFIKQSRGQVRIESELGQGTTVEIYLPRGAEEAELPVSEEHARIERVGDGERILAVEDDPNLRSLIAELLRRLGFDPVTAGDGKQALAALEAPGRVDLLLTDVVLPGGMNGAEIARRARELRPALPVLYMSGYSQDAIIHDGKLDADVRLLEKPFTSTALAQALQAALADGER